MAQEIERKFLLVDYPFHGFFGSFTIKQGYLHGDKNKNIRIRLTRDKAILGVKFTDKAITDEYEYEIPVEDGLAIYEKTKNRIEKRRITFQDKNIHYDIDEYPNGLLIVEAEFISLAQMESWVKPSWIGDEVTGFKEYSNVVMAKQNLTFKKDV